MAENIHVRYYCETEDDYKRTVQVDTPNPDWREQECIDNSHVTKDFVIEWVEEV